MLEEIILPILPEQTIRYKTYVKTSLVEALRRVFVQHPDTRLRKTKVTIEYPTSQNAYPTIIVRFFERDIKNIGVGHVEYIMLEGETVADKYRHYLYNGDIELAVFALSSLDRDLMADALVQTLAMPDTTAYTNNLLDRIYNPADSATTWTYINLNTDQISGFGETEAPQPWLSEDQLVYSTSYRIGIMGEFYSLNPPSAATGVIENVNFYPYIAGLEPVPTGEDDPSQWQ